MITTKVRLSGLEKILIAKSGASQSSNWASFWQIIFIDLSNLEIPFFEKIKSFLVKRLYSDRTFFALGILGKTATKIIFFWYGNSIAI